MNLYIASLREVNRETVNNFSVYSGTTYNVGDWVLYSGVYYKCIKTHTSDYSNPPTNCEYWARSMTVNPNDSPPTSFTIKNWTVYDPSYASQYNASHSVVNPDDGYIYVHSTNAWQDTTLAPSKIKNTTSNYQENKYWTRFTKLSPLADGETGPDSEDTVTTVSRYTLYTYDRTDPSSTATQYRKYDVVWFAGRVVDSEHLEKNFKLYMCTEDHNNYASVTGARVASHVPGEEDSRNYWCEIKQVQTDETGKTYIDPAKYPGSGGGRAWYRYVDRLVVADRIENTLKYNVVTGVTGDYKCVFYRKYRTFNTLSPSDITGSECLDNNSRPIQTEANTMSYGTTYRIWYKIFSTDSQQPPYISTDDAKYIEAKEYGSFKMNTYIANAKCIYDGYVYKCKSNYEAGEKDTEGNVKNPGTDSEHWELDLDNNGKKKPVYEFDYDGVIDDYISVEWIDRYSEYGTFVAKLPITEYNKSLIALDKYVVYGNHKTVMYIDSYKTYRDSDGEYIQISGKSLSALLTRRVVFPQENFDTVLCRSSGGLIYALKKLISDLFVFPENVTQINETTGDIMYYFPNRATNVITVKDDADTTSFAYKLLLNKSINASFSQTDAYEVLTTIASGNAVGFKMNLIRGDRYTKPEFQFEVYRGLDRTQTRAHTEVSPALFSKAFDNLKKSEYSKTNTDYKNFAISYTEKACDSYIDLRDFGSVFDSTQSLFVGEFKNKILEALGKTNTGQKITGWTDALRWKLVLALVKAAKDANPSTITVTECVVGTTSVTWSDAATKIVFVCKNHSKRPTITLDTNQSGEATSDIWATFIDSTQYEWLSVPVLKYACEVMFPVFFTGSDATFSSILGSLLDGYTTSSSRVKFLYATSSIDRSGLDRREVYAQKDDTKSKWSEAQAASFSAGSNNTAMLSSDDDEDETDEQTLLKLQKGADKIVGEYKIETDVSAELEENSMFQFDSEFYLGDIVDVDDGLNNNVKMFVTEFSITDDEQGIAKHPTFEKYKPIPERFNKLNYLSFAYGKTKALASRYANPATSKEQSDGVNLKFTRELKINGPMWLRDAYSENWTLKDGEHPVYQFISSGEEGVLRRPEYMSHPAYIVIADSLGSTSTKQYIYLGQGFHSLGGEKRWFTEWYEADGSPYNRKIFYTLYAQPEQEYTSGNPTLYVLNNNGTMVVSTDAGYTEVYSSTPDRYESTYLYYGDTTLYEKDPVERTFYKTFDIRTWTPGTKYNENQLVWLPRSHQVGYPDYKIYFCVSSTGSQTAVFNSDDAWEETAIINPLQYEHLADLCVNKYPFPRILRIIPDAVGPYEFGRTYYAGNVILSSESSLIPPIVTRSGSTLTMEKTGNLAEHYDIYDGTTLIATVAAPSDPFSSGYYLCNKKTKNGTSSVEWDHVSNSGLMINEILDICKTIDPHDMFYELESPFYLTEIEAKTSYAGQAVQDTGLSNAVRYCVLGVQSTTSWKNTFTYDSSTSKYTERGITALVLHENAGTLQYKVALNDPKDTNSRFAENIASTPSGETDIANIKKAFDIHMLKPMDGIDGITKFDISMKREDLSASTVSLVPSATQKLPIYDYETDNMRYYSTSEYHLPYIGISGCHFVYPKLEATSGIISYTDTVAGLYFYKLLAYNSYATVVQRNLWKNTAEIHWANMGNYQFDGELIYTNPRNGTFRGTGTSSDSFWMFYADVNDDDELEYEDVYFTNEFELCVLENNVPTYITDWTDEAKIGKDKEPVYYNVERETRTLANEYYPVQDTAVNDDGSKNDAEIYGLYDTVTGEFIAIDQGAAGSIYFTNGGVSNDDE